ncbi:uncharacterized protein EV420DRAFT_1640971 [Desarmillaria tabescens]|uniref:Uncharacterized protein n=1 Tax=Armillaria tabescens TaxID=1929756 RepID=A0AA39KG53_ARMTA|nr:uncharacterized protein EV420DRAFT_1640971 [Desarmillaria tabescens]KAK0460422.1 hypothetical protein EV420DRAFT_1640971 [Desarmillaria tabescens]
MISYVEVDSLFFSVVGASVNVLEAVSTARHRHEGQLGNTPPERKEHRELCRRGLRMRNKTASFAARPPLENGSLWRVKCQRGCEDQIVVWLTSANALKDILLSAFAISTARTWVYIQIQPPGLSTIKAFLASSAAIIQSYDAPLLEEMPFEEQARTLEMRDDKALQVYDWVVVTEGIYAGDLGCLVASYEWGWDVLVIPWLLPHESQDVRQRGMVTVPNLLTPDLNSKLEVDRGLIVLECPHQGVLRATAAPLEILALFQQSEHPSVIAAQPQAPCPTEWCFEVGELVAISDAAMHPCIGHIFQINNNDLDINLDNDSGIHHCPYIFVCKIFVVGDYVRWVDTGREGVVQHADQFHITVVQLYEDGHHEEFECAKNSVIKALPPKLDPLVSTIGAPFLPPPSLPLPPSQSYEHFEHWTHDHRLVGREFRVRIGGKAKVVMLQKGTNDHGAQAYIRRGKRKLELLADHKLIEAMHPANPRNYERWIVIRGEHTGKYVQAIRYDRADKTKGSLQWTVAIIEPILGELDKLTGENLELDSASLCLEAESDASKWRNMKFSRNLREEARC